MRRRGVTDLALDSSETIARNQSPPHDGTTSRRSEPPVRGTPRSTAPVQATPEELAVLPGFEPRRTESESLENAILPLILNALQTLP